jgi:hypothetical protein
VPPPQKGDPPDGVAEGGEAGGSDGENGEGGDDASPVPYSDVEQKMDDGYAEFAAARGGSAEDSGDPMDRSIDTWTDDDVKKVMRSDAYWSAGYPEHRAMQEKVRAWHVRTYDGPGGGGRSGGGPVHVSAHMRAGAHVSEYTRARPSR